MMAGTKKSDVSASKPANRRELADFNKNEWYPTRVANFKKWTYTGLASNASVLDYLGEKPCSSKVQSSVETLGLLSSSQRLQNPMILIKEEPDPTEPPCFDEGSTSFHLAPELYPEKPTLDKNVTPPKLGSTPRTMIKTNSQSRSQNPSPKTSEHPKPNPPTMTHSGLKRKLPQITMKPRPTKKPADNELWCQLCEVICSGTVNMQQHLRGRPHKAKMELTKKLKNMHAEGGGSIGNYTCDICHIWCTDRNGLGMHLNGKKHKAKVQEDLDKNRLVHCDTCGIHCMNVDSFRLHLKGRQHAMKQGCNDVSPSETSKAAVHFNPVKSHRVNNCKPRHGFVVEKEKSVSTRPKRTVAGAARGRWADYVDWEKPLKGIFKRRVASSSATNL